MPLNNGRALVRERHIGEIEHGGDAGEVLRLCIVRGMRGVPELLELRNWERRAPDGGLVPSPHGLQIPLSVVPWLIEKLGGLVPFEKAFEKEMMGGE